MTKCCFCSPTLGDGIIFGIGIAIALRLFGPPRIQHKTVVSSMDRSDACSVPSKAFHDCVNSNADDISKCQSYMDMLAAPHKVSGSTGSAASSL